MEVHVHVRASSSEEIYFDDRLSAFGQKSHEQSSAPNDVTAPTKYPYPKRCELNDLRNCILRMVITISTRAIGTHKEAGAGVLGAGGWQVPDDLVSFLNRNFVWADRHGADTLKAYKYDLGSTKIRAGNPLQRTISQTHFNQP